MVWFRLEPSRCQFLVFTLVVAICSLVVEIALFYKLLRLISLTMVIFFVPCFSPILILGFIRLLPLFCYPTLNLWSLIFIYVFDLGLCDLWSIQLFLLSHQHVVVSHASIFMMVLFSTIIC